MQYKYTVLTNTTIGGFMSLLDSNIVLISIPTIVRTLPGTTAFDGLWIIMGYLLVAAVLLLTIGRLGDIFGRVRLYNSGFAIFTIGSGLCSLSPNGTSLLIFRLIQGSGAALIWSNNAAMLTDAFPANERGRALGINQVAAVSGSIVGLIAGGVLTGLFGWRSIFWINIPVGIFATLWAFLKLKDISTPLRNEKIDYVGNALFGGGLTLFLLGLTLGATEGWAVLELAMMAVGVLTLVGFVFVEQKVKNPMIDLSLFKIRAFAAGATANLLSGLVRNSFSLILVVYFQGALLYDALKAGILLLPFSIAFVTFGPLSGYLSDRFGSRPFATAGTILSAVSYIWFSTLPYNVPYSTLALPMFIAGAGGGMFVAPNVAALISAAPPDRRGIASGISSTLISVGSLLSLGIVFAILGTSIPLPVLQAVFSGLPPPGGGLVIQIFTTTEHHIFLILAAVALVNIIPTMRTATRRRETRKETIIYSTED